MQWSPSGQVMEQLYDGVWGQWVADTRVLLERLPAALPALPVPEQVALTFERWLILLKARPARGLTAPPPSPPPCRSAAYPPPQLCGSLGAADLCP